MPKEFRPIEITFDLSEALGSQPVFDDAKGIIRNVAILTANKVSRNRTHYGAKAIAEALSRYEGTKMYLDHGDKSAPNRSVRDLGGVYRSLKMDGNYLRGDLHVREDMREEVFGIAKLGAKGVGLSIRDKGYGKETDGVFMVEGFKDGATHSIDLVTEASVNADLFESTEEGEDEMDFKTLKKEDLVKERPDLVEGFKNEAKAELAKEIAESKTTAAAASLKAEKLTVLAGAGFTDKEIVEAVTTMIMPEGVNLDGAKAIIESQKKILEKSAPKKKSNGEPSVKGLGEGREEEKAEEGDDKLPTSQDIAEAFNTSESL